MNSLRNRPTKTDQSFNPQKKTFSSMVGKLQLKLKRRPTIETLSRNGYYKNEPCFGNDLSYTIMHEVHFEVPKVIVESVKVLESNQLYMKSLGLYRISGSHAVIQKLRFKVKLTFKWSRLLNHHCLRLIPITTSCCGNKLIRITSQVLSSCFSGIYGRYGKFFIHNILQFFRELKKPMISLDQIKETIPKHEYNYFAGSLKLLCSYCVEVRWDSGFCMPLGRTDR